MKTIKRIEALTKRAFSLLLWKRDAKIIRKTIKQAVNNISPINSANSFRKIMILAPHSDDEWIGCFSLLEHYNCSIVSMNMKGGNDFATRDMRFQEMKIVGAKYNIPIFRINGDKVLSLRRIIIEEKPSHIAVPFFMDWHEEHIDTMYILRDALDDIKCDIITYQVSCPLPINSVNLSIPLSRQKWKQKWVLFKRIYKTQKWFPWRRFAMIEKAEGAYRGTFACNVFSVFGKKAWVDSFHLLLNGEEKQKVMKTLGSIYDTFCYINQLFQKIE